MRVTLISGFKTSVHTELNAFFAHLAKQADLTRKASAQGFSKTRKQFSHRAFAHLNQRFMMLVSSHLTLLTEIICVLPRAAFICQAWR